MWIWWGVTVLYVTLALTPPGAFIVVLIAFFAAAPLAPVMIITGLHLEPFLAMIVGNVALFLPMAWWRIISMKREPISARRLQVGTMWTAAFAASLLQGFDVISRWP